jgi:hypothetical protein
MCWVLQLRVRISGQFAIIGAHFRDSGTKITLAFLVVVFQRIGSLIPPHVQIFLGSSLVFVVSMLLTLILTSLLCFLALGLGALYTVLDSSYLPPTFVSFVFTLVDMEHSSPRGLSFTSLLCTRAGTLRLRCLFGTLNITNEKMHQHDDKCLAPVVPGWKTNMCCLTFLMLHLALPFIMCCLLSLSHVTRMFGTLNITNVNMHPLDDECLAPVLPGWKTNMCCLTFLMVH